MTVFLGKQKLNCCQAGKKINVGFSVIKVGIQIGLKVFLLKTFIQYFEHAECIAIGIFNLLGNA